MKTVFKPGVRVKAKVPLEKSPWAERGYIKRYDQEGFYVVERPGKSDVVAHEDDIELAEEDVDLTGILDIQTFNLLRTAYETGNEAYDDLVLNGAKVSTHVVKRSNGELHITRSITLKKPIESIWLKVVV